MRPMLARTYGPKYDKFPCYVQPKLNGVRCLYQYSKGASCFQSRDEKLWSHKVLQHLEWELETLQPQLGSAILDGELYYHTWRLQRINSAIAVKRNEPTPDTPHISFHVFDVVDPSRPFSERWIPLRNLLAQANLPHIHPVETSLVHDREQLERYFCMAVEQGYEGVMLRPDGPYEFGETPHGTQKRSKTLWKYKQWEDGEFECWGVTQGEGKADIGIGALELIAPTGWCGSKFRVGTGFSDEERIAFAANPPIGQMVRVRYPYLSEDGVPQCPSFVAIME